MKLRTNIKQYIKVVLPASLLAMSACNYLDVIPPAQPDFDDTMQDEASTLSFLYSAYSGTAEFTIWRKGHDVALATDEYVNPKDWDWNSLKMLYGSVSANDDIGDWENYYNRIGYVHYFLEWLDQLNPTGVTEEDKQQYRAEAWFLEAYYHFKVVENYGPCPIIETKIDQNILPGDIPGRSHFDYCVDWIVTKLDAAAEVLPAIRETQDLGRADATICKALKARVLLYAASPLWNGSFVHRNWRNTNYETPGYGLELVSDQYDAGKWERALTACQEALAAAQAAGYKLFDLEAANAKAAIDGVPLPFIPGKEEDTEENRLFKERVRMLQYVITAHEGADNKELIWGINPSTGNTIDAEPMRAHLPNRLVKRSDGTWNGGWHGTAPTWATVNRFYTENGLPPASDPAFYPESEWLTRYYEGTESPALSTDQLDSEEIKNDIIKFNVGREPRYYAWIAFDGCEYMPLINNNNPLWLNLKNTNTNGYSLSNIRNATGTGFLNKKFVIPNGVYLASGSFSGEKIRLPMIRMAELYLNLAECYAALGRTSEALENLNVIRERAGVPDLTAADFSTMSLMDWVRNERSIELHAEGHRYYDVRRWCIADKVMQPTAFKGLNGLRVNPSFEEFNQVVPIDQPIQWDVRQYLVPIKNSEVYSDPQLVQAPGY